MSTAQRILTLTTSIITTSLLAPTLRSPSTTSPQIHDAILAEQTASGWLDAQITDYKAAIIRRKISRKRKRESSLSSSSSSSSITKLKQRLGKLRQELFDKTIDSGQVHQILDRLKSSEVAQAVINASPPNFSNSNSNSNSTPPQTTLLKNSLNTQANISSNLVDLSSQLVSVRRAAALNHTTLTMLKAENDKYSVKLVEVIDAISSSNDLEREGRLSELLEKNILLKKCLVRIIMKTGVVWLGNERLMKVMLG